MPLQQLYQTIREKLQQSEYNVGELKTINFGIQFLVSQAGWSGVLRIYQNKKGVIKYDYSQLKSNVQAQKIEQIIVGEKEKTVYDVDFPVIGCDESGKGDYFGPLVCAAVFVDEQTSHALQAAGVRDSKALTDNRIVETASAILKIVKNNYKVTVLTPPEYNTKYKEFSDNRKNLNGLLAWLHVQTFSQVSKSTGCRNIFLDRFAGEHVISDVLSGHDEKFHMVQQFQGEQNIAVAAASILARARYLVEMKKLSETFQIELPKGATTVLGAARRFVKKYGKDHLQEVAKLHFKTTRDVLK